MQIGCSAPTSGPLIAPDSLVSIATEAEALGFDYITVSDHVMIPTSIASRYPYSESGEFPSGAGAARLEQLTAAAFIAAATSKLRIVTSVMVVPHRPAVLTAKILATIDYLSKGRLTLGIGAGWCKEEFEVIGAPPFDDRGHVTDEWMMACKELWSKEDPSFDGKYVKF
ncbi:MAG TPA: LLM class flavin-dependent oxidoreductase, partial [Acetobacteraceae bacterium]|nr:LLM class flavin-dependent oxidoreductase [Acetobacteraceae bacterium]